MKRFIVILINLLFLLTIPVTGGFLIIWYIYQEWGNTYYKREFKEILAGKKLFYE